MGKGRDRRKRRVKKNNRQVTVGTLTVPKSSGDPPVLGEPDAPVLAPLKPRPHLRSGAIAIPEPEPEGTFVVVSPRMLSE